MNIETLSKQGREQVHTGLAGIDTTKLKSMRNASLRDCFERMADMSCRLEPVARIKGHEFINDAASRNVNSTWYSLESLEGRLTWIAIADASTNYDMLRPSVKRKVDKIYVIGDASHIRQTLGDLGVAIEECTALKDAVSRAHYTDDTTDRKVLFSPACSNGLPTGVLSEEFRYAVNEL